MAKREHGEGSIQKRGKDTFRLRYRIEGQRFEKTFRGTQTEARKELRRLLKSGDDGGHVPPTKITVGQWIDQWLLAGAPGRRRKKVSQRTLERYGELLRTHVQPVLGHRPLQQLRAPEIDQLYAAMAAAGEIAPQTQHHVHTVFGAMLATAERKAMIAANPMARVEQIPNAEAQVDDLEETDEDDIGDGLDEAELAALVAGFKPSASHYPVVATAAATGARRNELLALRWPDLDEGKKTLRIERAWEQTKKFGLRLKPPKTRRGLRTISLDAATVTMLIAERATHLRIQAGIPDGVDVDLSLIRLPPGALMFPATPAKGQDFDFTAPRNPRNFSKEFARRAAKLGFGSTRFHDLRGIHSTALLDAGIPVHTVAQRIGDDPATLLRAYTKRKRTKKADDNLSGAIEAFASGFMKP
jgi:integrase